MRAWLDRYRPLLLVGLFVGWIVGWLVAAAVLAGCATPRDNAVASINAASAFGATAEVVLRELDVRAQEAALAGTQAPEDRRARVEAVRQRFGAAWQAYRDYRAAWLAAAATARAYDDAVALGQHPDATNLLLAARALAEAEARFAAAAAALGGGR